MGVVTKGIPKDITIELARLNNSMVFVETGTYQGDTTRWASEHFESVHTIERAENLYRRHSGELSLLGGVTPHLGDSRTLLPEILRGIGDRKCVFWLDGHWSGGDTAGEKDECPLLGELACLSGRHDDIIMIDDAHMFLCAPPSPHDPKQWPTISEIISVFPKADKAPFVQIVDDVIFMIPERAVLRDSLVEYARRRSDLFWKEFSKRDRGSAEIIVQLSDGLKRILRGTTQ